MATAVLQSLGFSCLSLKPSRGKRAALGYGGGGRRVSENRDRNHEAETLNPGVLTPKSPGDRTLLNLAPDCTTAIHALELN